MIQGKFVKLYLYYHTSRTIVILSIISGVRADREFQCQSDPDDHQGSASPHEQAPDEHPADGGSSEDPYPVHQVV